MQDASTSVRRKLWRAEGAVTTGNVNLLVVQFASKVEEDIMNKVQKVLEADLGNLFV